MPIWAALAGVGAAVLPYAQTSVQTLTPSSLAFGTVVVGAISPGQTLTFSTNAPVTLDRIDTFGEFGVIGGTCGVGPVAAGSSCTIIVNFTPQSPGQQSGNVTVTYNGDVLRQSLLSGTGVPPPTTTPPPPRTTQATTTTARPPSTTTTGRPDPTTTRTTAPPETTTSVAETTTTSTSTTTTTVPPPPARRGPTLDAVTAGGGRAGPPGIGITVTGAGYPPAARDRDEAAPAGPRAQADPACATIYFFLDGQRIGADRPNAAGDVRKDGLSVPGGTEPGAHEVTSSCRSSGTPIAASSTFEVTNASLHRTQLATSLPQADQVDFGAGPLLPSLLAVAGLLVLIAFPAELFNTTLEEHYDEVRGWFGLKPRPPGPGRHHGVLLAACLALSGPLWFAIQPSSGFDAATAAGAAGLSLATAVVVLAADLPAVRHVRRRYGERAGAVALPGSMVVAVACVVLSRAVNFQPGYFYGLVGGLALSRTLERDESGRVAARTVALLLGLSFAAWLALLPVSAAAAESGRTLTVILAENVLAGIFWAALDSLVIAMLPLRLLEGAKVAGWNRAAWAGLYSLTLLAFVHILLRPSTGYVSNTSVSPAGVVVGLFVAFGVFSFAFWGYFRFRRPRTAGGSG